MRKKVQFYVVVFIVLGGIIISRPLYHGLARAIVDSSNGTDKQAVTKPLDLEVSEGALIREEPKQDRTKQITEQDSFPQAIIETSELFLKNCFSANSALEDLDLTDHGALGFQEYVKSRQHLINLRREAFSYAKKIDSFALRIDDVVIRNDCAIVLGVATENYSYSDSPNHNAGSAVDYLVILRNTDSGWRIYWATSNDAYSKMLEEKSNHSTVRGLPIPYSTRDDVYSDLYHAKDYSSDAIFRKCTDFAYRNFAMMREYELENIERELGEPQEKNDFAPQSIGDFSRFAMMSYQNNWALSRNPAWQDYSPPYGGGDCQNYVSQIIKAGGAPFDDSSSHKWYWYSDTQRTASWTGVNSMQNYIRYNTGLGPNGVFVSSASSLLTGDMVHIDWDNDGSYNHAVAIYNPGSSPTISGHTEDCINKKLSDYPGAKQYIHFTHYGN